MGNNESTLTINRRLENGVAMGWGKSGTGTGIFRVKAGRGTGTRDGDFR